MTIGPILMWLLSITFIIFFHSVYVVEKTIQFIIIVSSAKNKSVLYVKTLEKQNRTITISISQTISRIINTICMYNGGEKIFHRAGNIAR